MEQHMKQHAPAGLAMLAMVLTGGLVNHPPNHLLPNVTSVDVEPKWCRPWQNQTTQDLPPAITPLAITASVILPLVPLLLNSKLIWTESKAEMMKSHFLGQSSSFGVSELFRHYATLPSSDFMQKCNITEQDCKALALAKSQLFFHADGANDNQTVCERQDVFDDLHHFPNVTCALLGASIVSFISVLMYWHVVNKKGKAIYQANPLLKMFIVALQCLLILIFCMYIFYLYKKLEFVHFVSVLLGAGIQILVSVSMMRQQQTVPAENEKKEDFVMV